ncbi:MAG: DUF992 domain-containing protein [Rhizobiales bacterium]|nr:DUF992 domain-containing protein [Hyphomicrobiales bacterium]
MRIARLLGGALIALSGSLAGSGAALARVDAGLLSCEVSGGVALIISEPRELHCVFQKANGQSEAYEGELKAFGIDIGVSGRGVMTWGVIAATTELPPGTLAGTYGGVEAGGAAVVGGRGQILVGGAKQTISLQPLSVEGETGLNIAVGVTAIELRPLLRGRPADGDVRLSAVGFTYDEVPHHRQESHYGCGSYTHLQRGQTLFGIAHACGVTVEALLLANPQITNVRRIPTGAVVHVPNHVGHHGTSPCGDRAILQPGESLDHLAWRCGVTLHGLLVANPDARDAARIEDGLVLVVPIRAAPARELPVLYAMTRADLANDATVEGTDFNATGMLSCSRGGGRSMASCRFGVIRKGNGNGTITVFWPDGGNRVIYFEDNTPMSYAESQADGGARMTVGRTGDDFDVRVGEQHFVIPDVVMTGD